MTLNWEKCDFNIQSNIIRGATKYNEVVRTQ